MLFKNKKWTLVALLVSTSGHAYILPPMYYFQNWIDQSSSIKNVSMKWSHQGEHGDFIEEVIIARPGLMYKKSKVNGQDDIRILGRTKALRGETVNSLRQVPLQDVLFPLDFLLLYNQNSTVDAVVKRVKIDSLNYGLEWIQNGIFVRIGEKLQNRFYIDKTTERLGAFFYNGLLYILKFEKTWGGVSLMPSGMDVIENGKVVDRITLMELKTNETIPPGLFDVPQ